MVAGTGLKIAFLVAAVSAAKLPGYLKTCSRSDSKFHECLRENVQDAIHKLEHGAPELGLKPLDPLEISSLEIGEGTGPVNVRQNFKNVKLHGISSTKVTKYNADLEHYHFYTDSISPELRLEADYDLNGKILLLPVQGQGPCTITLINAYLNHTMIGEPFEKKGKTYLKIVDYKVSINPEKIVFKFDNLFNGDKRLGDEINRVINENWDEIFKDVKASYDESFGLIFRDLANRVFSKVPINDIFRE